MAKSGEGVKEILRTNLAINKLLDLYIEELQSVHTRLEEQNKIIEGMSQKIDELTKARTSRGGNVGGSGGSGSRRVTALYKRIEKDADVIAAREENMKNKRRGSVRVGKIAPRNLKGGERYPKTKGFINIAVTSHNTSGVGAELSPFKLHDEEGHIMENIWQFAKIYPFVPNHTDKKTGWTWDRELHINKKTNEVLPAYWEWRHAGMKFQEPMRYPVGYGHRGYCRSHVWPESGLLSDAINMEAGTPRVEYKYIPARVKIYCPVYMEMARKCEDFATISQLLDEGYNVQILDVDGPEKPEEVMSPYDQMPDGEYGEDGVGSIEINEANIKAMLNDVNQAFGHGYALACQLLEHPEWILDHDVSDMNSDEPDELSE